MSRKILALAAALAAVAGFPTVAGAQMCPDTCPVNFSVIASGSFQTGDLVTLTPLNVKSGQSALLGGIGGGFVCNTCVPCSAEILVSWRITTSSCVSYNMCGLLQNGPGSGSSGTTLTRACNSNPLNLKLEYGTCNITGTCPPPVVSPAQYTATWTLTCGDCQ